MRLIRFTIGAILVCVGAPMHAQQRAANKADSARRVVQTFYDWYVPRAANPRGRDMIMAAATHGPVRLGPELSHWLRIDSTARARSKDEVNGLDGDPYLNAQDPCKEYTAQPSTAVPGGTFMVPVLGRGGCAPHETPDVFVELAHRPGGWMILEFRDPNRKNEGTIPLLKRLHPKAR